MAEYDLIVRDGMIFDGANNPRYRADLGISDGLIRTIGKLDAAQAERTLDASGLHVAPGFIDLHTHYDSQLFWDPYCSVSGWHGVTSLVMGNCGFGFAPMAPEYRERAMQMMVRAEALSLESMRASLPWDWVSFPEYLDSVERAHKAVNLVPFFPVSPLLIWVLGLEAAKAGELPSDDQHAEMRRLLNEAMDAGACGWSAQRLPPHHSNAQRDFDGSPMVSDLMHDETCLELAKVLRDRNEGFVEMVHFSGDPARDLQHFEQLAEISRRPILFNAVSARKYGPMHRPMLAWLKSCHERGLRVYGQGVMTGAGSTFTFEYFNLWDDSDAWREICEGTNEEKMLKFADPARRQALKDNPNLPVATSAVEDVVLTVAHSAELKSYEGMSIGDIARETGRDPVDAICEIALKDGLRSEFFMDTFDGPPEYHRELVDDKHLIAGVSDGGAHSKFLSAGRWTTEFLAKYTRDRAWLSLEEAHWRLSGYPAFCAGFKGRGVIREGAAADLVVYDYANLELLPQEKVYDVPGGDWRRVERAKGYRYVVVNGEVTIENDQQTGTHSGLLLRHGEGKPTPRAR